MTELTKRRIAVALLAVLILASGAAAYTVVFTAGAGGGFEAGSGLEVYLGTDQGISDRNPFNDSSTIYLSEVNVTSTHNTSVTIDQFTGTYTNLSSIDATNGSIYIDPHDKSQVVVSGNVTAVDWEDAALDGTHQLTYSASGPGTIIATGLPASTEFAAATTGGDVLTTGTTTSDGEATIDARSATDEQVVLLEPESPQVSNLSPNNTETNNENVDLSFDISDPDFAKDSGDSINITLDVDGSQENTWTGVSSNQTLTYTATGLADGQHSWSVSAEDEYGLTSTGSATFTVNHYTPNFDNNSASPSGDLTQIDVTFTIDISDIDFGESSGDTVTANLYVDGSNVGSDTLTSNDTASVTHTISTGGDHTYYWTATDEYGKTATSQDFTISAPSKLRVYNESDPTELLTNATVEIRFYANESGDATIVQKNTTNGTIDLTGLPVDKPLIAVAQAENYTTRRIFIESIYQQNKLYLLPVDATLTNTIFSLEDYTGNYPGEETALQLQRSLNGTYQTVLGDFFGATGQFPAQLEYNIRHRMVLVNAETGERRILGTFTPIGDTTQQIVVTPEGTDPIDGEPPTVVLQPSTRRLPAVSDATLGVSIDEGTDPIDSWSVTATLKNETTSTQIWYYDQQGPGEENTTVDLRGHSDKLVNVTVTYSVDGVWISKTHSINVAEHYNTDTTLMSGIASLIHQSGDGSGGFTTFLAMLLTILMTGSVASIQPSGELAGLVGVLLLVGFAALGWVSYGLVFVAGIGLVSMAAIRRGI